MKTMPGDALRNVVGPLSDFSQKLLRPDGLTKWLPAFKRFLRGENPWDGAPLFEAWKTLRTGRFSSLEQIEQLYEAVGISIVASREAAELASKLTGEVDDFDLVLVTPAQLGASSKRGRHFSYTQYGEFFALARDAGLQPCSPALIFEARYSYLEQECYDEETSREVKFLMEPIKKSLVSMTHDSCGGDQRLRLDSYDLDDNYIEVYGANVVDVEAQFLAMLPRQ